MATRTEYHKQWREKNKDKINERQRNWQRENKEKVRKYRKTYLDKGDNREKVNDYKRQYYAENIDAEREKNRIRQARFRERQKALKEQENGL